MLPTTRDQKEVMTDPLLEASGRARPCQHLNSRLPASRAAGQYVPVAPSRQVRGALLDGPR